MNCSADKKKCVSSGKKFDSSTTDIWNISWLFAANAAVDVSLVS
jgi:hypothetical protein